MAQDGEQQAQDWLDGQVDAEQAQAFEQGVRDSTQLQSYVQTQQAYRDVLRSMAHSRVPTGLATRLLVKARWHGIKQTLLPLGAGFAGGTLATLFAVWLLLPSWNEQSAQGMANAAISNSAPLISQLAYWQPAESGAVAVVNLEASADKPLVSVRVILPPEMEMEGFPGYDIVEWDTPILRGFNKLLLPLISHSQAPDQNAGQNVRLELLYDGNKTQTFQLPANAPAGEYIF